MRIDAFSPAACDGLLRGIIFVSYPIRCVTGTVARFFSLDSQRNDCRIDFTTACVRAPCLVFPARPRQTHRFRFHFFLRNVFVFVPISKLEITTPTRRTRPSSVRQNTLFKCKPKKLQSAGGDLVVVQRGGSRFQFMNKKQRGVYFPFFFFFCLMTCLFAAQIISMTNANTEYNSTIGRK